MDQNKSFEQEEEKVDEVSNSSMSVINESKSSPNSNKMSIDDLNDEEKEEEEEENDFTTETESISSTLKINSNTSSTGSLSKRFNIISISILSCLDLKVSNITSVINESSAVMTEIVESPVTVAVAAPPITNPTTSSNPPSNTSTNSSTQSMQLNDAFAYLDRVRAEFADQPEIYNKFLQVMREFKSNR